MGGGKRRRLQLAVAIAVVVVLAVVASFFLDGSDEQMFRNIEAVQLLDQMAGPLAYSEVDLGAGLEDFVAQECPQAQGDVVRGTFTGRKTSLIIYAIDDSDEVVCVILRPGETNVSVRPAGEDGVALRVNGKDVQAATIARIAQELGNGSSADAIVNRAINDELIAQEAQDIPLTQEEIAAERKGVLVQLGVTEEDLKGFLDERGLSQEDFSGSIEQQARVAKLLKARLGTDRIEVTDESAREFYLQNPNVFLRTEQATMRHIFISAEQTNALSRAQQVADLLNSTDFCELVKRFSDDAQSVENCGVYVIPRGVVQPDVEYAAFSTPQGQTAIVQTEQGIHFVQSLQVAPSQVLPYSDVGESLKGSLRDSVFQERLNLYLTVLRGDATVVIFTQ